MRYCYDCQGNYRGLYIIHQGTVRHRHSTRVRVSRKRSGRPIPSYIVGRYRQETEADAQAWLEAQQER